MSIRRILCSKTNALTDATTFAAKKIAELRRAQSPYMSQRMLADRLQLMGLDVDKNAVQRMECGKRFITDIELAALCRTFGVTPNALLGFGDTTDAE